MMNKFKFGDRVKHQKYGTGFVINNVANIAEVIFEDRSYRDVKATDIELIPHPDTVRLDFINGQLLKRNTVEFYNDDYSKNIKYCKIFLHEDRGYDDVHYHHNNVRDLIDVAISFEIEHMTSSEEYYFYKYLQEKQENE